MAAPRSNAPRGTRVRGESSPPPRSGPPPQAEPVDDPTRPRAVIDYALQRRATLEALFSGGGLSSDVCDADPYLMRAAKFHGEPTERTCPVCRRTELDHVTYVYGDELGAYSGRVRSTAELAAMATNHGEFRVYVVEVCQSCGWNHLSLSYVLGDGVPRRPPPRPRDLLE